jgi:hypothetical protein
MKDIIAKLDHDAARRRRREAPRGAAPRCHALHRGAGSALLLLFGLATSVLAQPASSSEAVWHAPNGRFSFTFPASWGVMEPSSNHPPQVLAHFGQTTTLVERKECFVDAVVFPQLHGRDQSAISAVVARWTAGDALGHLGGPRSGVAVTGFSNDDVQGVRAVTLAFEVDRPNALVRGRSRQFVLVEGARAIRYGVHCVVADAGSSVSDVEALIASLRFHQNETTQ